jgi:hypothetical protein
MPLHPKKAASPEKMSHISLASPALKLCSLLLITTLFASCVSSKLTEKTDYALAVGHPYPAETARAQQRVAGYLSRLSPDQKGKIAQYGHVAVDVMNMPVSEVPGLSQRILSDQKHDFAAVGGNLQDRLSASTTFIMIFDAKTGRQSAEDGFIVMDKPRKGQPGSFGGYTAIYIGNGR